MIADAYLARVREHLPDAIPATFLPDREDRHLDRTHRFQGNADAVDGNSTREVESDQRERGARRREEDRDRHQPWRQRAAMTLVAQDLRAHHGMLAVTTSWFRFGVPDGLFPEEELRHGIHGGAVETSIMLARYAQHVRVAAIADFAPRSIGIEKRYRWLSTQRPAPFAWQAQDLHPSGAVGNATLASAAKGEALLEHGARGFIELLDDVDKFDVRDLSRGPRK